MNVVVFGSFVFCTLLIAQTVVFENPDRILKAVLIGTNPPGHNKEPIEEAFYKAALKPINDIEDEYVLFFEPASDDSKMAADASHKRIYDRLDVAKIPSDQEIFQRYFSASKEFREDPYQYRDKITEISCPVLVISGDHDISFAVENWFPLLRKAKKIQHFILPDSGHGPHHQAPKLIAEYIKVFIMNS
ncbi:alpha/beta hydrolase [Galbibacter sp. PAP.153]|uniref:alpha/beta hydrolase n=1 Tax=Galbibacter sp. PAP.153 TaxID=3104623 RepID=UPI0030090473